MSTLATTSLSTMINFTAKKNEEINQNKQVQAYGQSEEKREQFLLNRTFALVITEQGSLGSRVV